MVHLIKTCGLPNSLLVKVIIALDECVKVAVEFLVSQPFLQHAVRARSIAAISSLLLLLSLLLEVVVASVSIVSLGRRHLGATTFEARFVHHLAEATLLVRIVPHLPVIELNVLALTWHLLLPKASELARVIRALLDRLLHELGRLLPLTLPLTR